MTYSDSIFKWLAAHRLKKTYLSEFRWRNFHRNDDKFNALMCCIAALYVVYIDIIISHFVLLIVQQYYGMCFVNIQPLELL